MDVRPISEALAARRRAPGAVLERSARELGYV
jgi:hypothetical protein